MGSFQSRANLKMSIDYIPTSVCTMDIRYDLISDTSPKMSTNSCSRMCCKSLSRAMNVPVRPTPALQEFRECVTHTVLPHCWKWRSATPLSPT